MLYYKDRKVISSNSKFKEQILREANCTPYTALPDSNKMYRDLKGHYWWDGIKRDVAEFVSKCPICQLVKVEHQRQGGELQPLLIPEWKWEDISIDFELDCQGRCQRRIPYGL